MNMLIAGWLITATPMPMAAHHVTNHGKDQELNQAICPATKDTRQRMRATAGGRQRMRAIRTRNKIRNKIRNRHRATRLTPAVVLLLKVRERNPEAVNATRAIRTLRYQRSCKQNRLSRLGMNGLPIDVKASCQ